jgi:hypothetical protein
MSRQLHGRTYVTSVISPCIRAILECVGNPQVVAIHALWYITKITMMDCHRDGDDFLGVSIFNHLHLIPPCTCHSVTHGFVKANDS